jgi:hypothetical protein
VLDRVLLYFNCICTAGWNTPKNIFNILSASSWNKYQTLPASIHGVENFRIVYTVINMTNLTEGTAITSEYSTI